jgi:hypothetical protein
LATLQDNCLQPATNYGVNNLVPQGVITATQNWWGSPGGPSHASHAGSGVPVSDHVLFSAWLASPPAQCQATAYAIQGRVARVGDSPVTPDPLPGVTIVLSSGAITATSGTGNFAFNGLPAGEYSLQPFLSGYTFSPATWEVNLPPSAAGLTFIGTAITGQTFTVGGRIVDRQGQGVPGVTVLATTVGGAGSGIATSGADGNYTIASVAPGTHVVTPLLAGYTFTPASRQVVVSGNMAGQDFVRRDAGETNFLTFLPAVRK